MENNNIAEFAGQIVDIVEDFLTEEGIILDNPEREEAEKDGSNPEEIAIIYGSDYDYIANPAMDAYKNCLKAKKYDKEEAANRILEGFAELLEYRHVNNIFRDKCDAMFFDNDNPLRMKILETLTNWETEDLSSTSNKMFVAIIKGWTGVMAFAETEEKAKRLAVKQKRFMCRDDNCKWTWDGVSEYYGAFTQEIHDGTVMTEY